MLKRRIETFIGKITEANAYDRRLDPKGTGWYFPGHWDATPDLPVLEGENPYPDSDTMIELIEQGTAETDRELAATSQELASIALNGSVQSPNSFEN